MAATIGKGFREIWRPQGYPSGRSRRATSRAGTASGLDAIAGSGATTIAQQFGKDPQPLDITSLHFAVAGDRVNVHLDETGFVFEGADGALTVGPNFGHYAPAMSCSGRPACLCRAGAAEHIDLILPNSANDFSRVGISVDMYRTKDLRVTATGSCGIFGGFECSGTVSVSGTHDLLGGRR